MNMKQVKDYLQTAYSDQLINLIEADQHLTHLMEAAETEQQRIDIRKIQDILAKRFDNAEKMFQGTRKTIDQLALVLHDESVVGNNLSEGDSKDAV